MEYRVHPREDRLSRIEFQKGPRASRGARLIILSGPSCAGKSPLRRTLRREFPDLTADLAPVLLYNSRRRRPGESEGEQYLFRERSVIEALRADDRYLVREVRGDLQALDIEAIRRRLTEGDALFEGNVTFASLLMTDRRLRHARRLSVFLSPLSRDAIRLLRQSAGAALPDVIAELMRGKLIARARRWTGRDPAAERMEALEERAAGAYDDLRKADRFDYVIPCRDGEESDNWERFEHPVGDARDALLCMATLLRDGIPEGAESWRRAPLPGRDRRRARGGRRSGSRPA